MRKHNNGITLIALVITIILLLILAGVSLNLIAGSSGIITKATKAVNEYENASENEKTQLNEIEKEIDRIINGNLQEGESSESATKYTAYNIGDEVTIGDESFYVLETSDENTSTVTLLTKYNLNTAGTTQQNANYTETACAFSSANYWSSIAGITYPYDLNNTTTLEETDAIAKAKSYASFLGGTGRLMTYEEALALKDSYPDMIYGKTAIDGYLIYYLSSAEDSNGNVRFVDGSMGYLYYRGAGSSDLAGVRPVITISKSLLS